ncbi:CopL family metal-binding regulatory protein [Luteimonas saliphila]|uniref:CopL family metal-binding regulatory protein n=1 Tax=Luteimonas saliphila TaxID=2804919 RepID=UPI00192E184B
MFPVLLRLLLCLGLLLDTVAPAVAATHVAMSALDAGAAMPMAVDQAPDRAGHAAADCHTRRDATPPPTAPSAQGDDDCLQRCLDLCLQHGFAALSPMPPVPAAGHVPGPSRTARTQVHAVHAFPLLRPPIA